jgi:hypothetical protein
MKHCVGAECSGFAVTADGNVCNHEALNGSNKILKQGRYTKGQDLLIEPRVCYVSM